jgi:polar amino acid transport system substrate-binding protein
MTIRARLVPCCAALASAAVLAGCTSPGARPAAPLTTSAATRTAALVKKASHAAVPACNPEASSLAPVGPPDITPGSWMAHIRTRGHLIAGVDQNTYHFEYYNPLDGQIEGFDIDMVNAVAKAIFGTAAGHVVYKAISDNDRIPDIQKGIVDIVAHTMSIKCDRLQQVAFSAVYFIAHERILVPKNSAVQTRADLGGKKVCVTSSSDSAAGLVAGLPPAERPVIESVPYITDCLVLLQQDQVAAIASDDSILDGLMLQDQFVVVRGPALTDELYGLAISKLHPEFVQFVNAVLAREIASGAWLDRYKYWISTKNVPSPPPQEYAK